MTVPIADRTVGDAAGVISYHAAEQADDYRSWDDAGSWLLGYAFVPQALGLSEYAAGGRVLDLGCGPGEVTRWLAERCPGARFTAVDSSAAMVELARRHNPHPSVEYRCSEHGGMPFLADGTMDAATASFLFTCFDELADVRALIAEVRRVLRPGGRFTLLHPHPEQVADVSFEGFRRGRPGAAYACGDPMPIDVQRRDGSWTTITNTYWPLETLRAAFLDAGFGELRELAPVLADAVGVADRALVESRPWAREREHPPFLLLTGTAV